MIDAWKPLILDGLNRALRTALQQGLLSLSALFVTMAANPTDLEAWKVGLIGVAWTVASALLAFVHRVIVDPSSLRSAAPPDTPVFREAPVDPPVPLG